MAPRRKLQAAGLVLGLASTFGVLSAEAQERPKSSRRLTIVPRTANRAPAPLPAPPTTPPPEAADLPDDVELIRERYKNGAVKIDRYVTQDEQDNYVNHGPWTYYDQKGNKLGGGRFEMGKQEGRWWRLIVPAEARMLAGPLYKGFTAPFRVEVDLTDGQLHGAWTVYDARNLKCSEWHFDRGRRQGKSSWYHPAGNLSVEADYRDGVLNGKVLAWNAQGEIVQDDGYIEGRKHAKRALQHPGGGKRAEGLMLFAPQAPETAYDWWNCTITTEKGPTGLDEKHGEWTWWYPNGQKYCTGRYIEDEPVGQWMFWHANGQKHFEGEYVAGVQTGTWKWWKEDGSLERSEEHGASGNIGQLEGPADLDPADEEANAATDEDTFRNDDSPTPPDAARKPARDDEGSASASDTDDELYPVGPEIGSLRLPALD